jgi:hypothetical protein
MDGLSPLVQRIVPTGGDITCHIFENLSAGVPRSLFWSVTVDFKPITYEGDDVDRSCTYDWIPWTARDWFELNGRKLELAYGQEGVEASFYAGEHYPATRMSLSLHHRRANVFSIRMEMILDSPVLGGSSVHIHADVEAAFTGLIMVPQNLVPEPATASELKRIASEFVDLSVYGEPEPWRRHAYLFRPLPREKKGASAESVGG